MTDHAHQERLALAGALREVGPEAPTLCEGWTSRDLVAHLLQRERRPDAGLGLLFGPLRGYTERVRRGYLDRDYDEMVELFARTPWWSHLSNPLTDELINTVEMFVHHEDVRRARPDWAPRQLSDGLERALWRRLALFVRLMRRLPARLTLVAPGLGERTAGQDGPQVRLTGPPSELVLFTLGRQRATRLTDEGPPDVVSALYQASFGL